MFESFGLVSFTSHTKVGDVFVAGLVEGRLLASRCASCGEQSFPPRADCVVCRSGDLEWVEISGRGRVSSFTTIRAAPVGLEEWVPYSLVLVDLEEGGRALALAGAGLDVGELSLGTSVRLNPCRSEVNDELRVYYEVEADS